MLKMKLIGAVAIAASLVLFSGQADAFFGHSHGSHGSSGSWGSHGSSGSWGSSGGWGSHGSWGGWHHRRVVYWGSHGSSGSWGSHGSSGSWGSYGSSGGSSGGYIVPQETGPPPVEEVAPTEARLNVRVPATAKVFVNDAATTSTGSSRRYVSRGLKTGASYTYTIRAEIQRDGDTVAQTKTVQVQAGQASNLMFSFDSDEQVASAPVKTALILRVPSQAKVTLAGQPTTSTGEVREFATTALAGENAWQDYPIVVQLERDGQMLTQEKTVSLKAGETREISFDFDTAQVAAKQ